VTRERLAGLGNEFAQEKMEDFVTPAASEQLRWHQAQGHLCVLASASLAVYVEPWATRMGFDHAVATNLAFDSQGHFSGRFDGEPCWGNEKLRRVQDVVGSFEESTVVVYGNEKGDAALLAAADMPVLIRGPGAWSEVAAEVRRAL
jgi:phosphatidylglycerophosphatase C